jgi:hypothetical protein
MARALAPTTFQTLKPSERLKDAPPGIAQMYGGAAQDDIASRGANAAKKTVEYGGTAGLIAGDIGVAGIQIGYSGVRSAAVRSVEKEVVKETLGKTTAYKLIPKPKSGLDSAVGEGVAVSTVRIKVAAEAILNRGALKRGTVAIATHGVEQVHITTGKVVKVLTGELANITEKQLIQIAKGGVGALEKSGVEATRIELLVCGGANARLCSSVASELGLPTVAHSGVIDVSHGYVVRSGAKRVALPVLR